MQFFSRYTRTIIVSTVFACLLGTPVAFAANAPAAAKPAAKPAVAAPVPAAPAPAVKPAAAPVNPKLDPHLKKCLDELEYIYDSNNIDGACRITLRLGKERSHQVFVGSKKEAYGGVDFRKIWATAMKSKELPSNDIMSKLLQDSALKKLGGWELPKWPDGYYRVLLVVKVPADCSAAVLKAGIRAVLFGADDMEEQLTKKDEF